MPLRLTACDHAIEDILCFEISTGGLDTNARHKAQAVELTEAPDSACLHSGLALVVRLDPARALKDCAQDRGADLTGSDVSVGLSG